MKKRRGKVTHFFANILGIISILGFLGVALDSFGIINLNNEIGAFIFMLIGVGLCVEGNIRGVPKMLKHGITTDETSHIAAVTLGLLGVVVGVVVLLGYENQTFTFLKAVLSVFVILMIAIETWVVK